MYRSIASGKIKKIRGQSLRGPMIYDLRFLDEGSLQAVSNLQELIARNLPCAEIFHLSEDDYFKSLLKRDRHVIGVVIDDTLIAYSLISIPGRCTENLGRDICMPAEELERAGHLQATAVHPDYRGNGLQRAMGAVHLGVIENMGATHVLCTVSPRNPVSLRNILANGFVIAGLKLKFEGIWRYIMYKNLLQPACLRSLPAVITSSDIEGQLALLGKGYLGYGIRMHDADFEVHYALPR